MISIIMICGMRYSQACTLYTMYSWQSPFPSSMSTWSSQSITSILPIKHFHPPKQSPPSSQSITSILPINHRHPPNQALPSSQSITSILKINHVHSPNQALPSSQSITSILPINHRHPPNESPTSSQSMTSILPMKHFHPPNQSPPFSKSITSILPFNHILHPPYYQSPSPFPLKNIISLWIILTLEEQCFWYFKTFGTFKKKLLQIIFILCFRTTRTYFVWIFSHLLAFVVILIQRYYTPVDT